MKIQDTDKILAAIKTIDLPKLDHLEVNDTNQSELLKKTLREVVLKDLIEPLVEIVYKKQGTRNSRMPGRDYKVRSADPRRHFGNVTMVGINRRGELYFRMKDFTRAREGEEFGYTAISPFGIISFILVAQPSLS